MFWGDRGFPVPSDRAASTEDEGGCTPRGVCDTIDGEVVGGKKLPIGVAVDPSLEDSIVGIDDGVDRRPVCGSVAKICCS